MIKDFFIYFNKKDISIRFYIVAVAVFFIGIFFIKKDVDIFLKIFYISMGLFEIGFVVWVYSF
ncbi:hypothetical protein ABTD37_20390, partial [Acinetobacter baumannii]